MKETAGMDTSVKQKLECFEEINQHDSGNAGHRNIDEQAKKCDGSYMGYGELWRIGN
jgi:hypothetical protein